MKTFYKLVDRKPVACESAGEWAQWFETACGEECVVARAKVGDVTVCTDFLGTFEGGLRDEPVLFETMVFGGELDRRQWRTKTWDEAVACHEQVAELVRKAHDNG